MQIRERMITIAGLAKSRIFSLASIAGMIPMAFCREFLVLTGRAHVRKV
jgi:hypothetical protein